MAVEPGSLLGACDVLLITATDRETTALRVALEAVSSAEPSILRGRRKTYTDHGEIAGTRVVRVRCEMGAGAVGGASSTVADAIHEVAPRAVIMVGIAFGAKGKAKQRLGTILVSQQLQDYELQRVGTGSEGGEVITPRGDRVSASPRLVDRLRHARESWTAKEPVAFGLVLSGDKLVDNIDFLKTLKERFPEAIGGEMEGRGLYVEAKDRAEWILVKAVCDWADGNKRKNKARNQKKAAEAAAGFVVHALLQGGFGSGRRQSWRSESSPGTSSPDREVLGSQSPPPPPPRPPLVVLFNIGDRGDSWMTPERLAAAQGLDLRGASYIRLNHEIDRSAITPEEWQELAQGLDGLVSQAEAVTPEQASRCIVAGQAPLPVFAYLGQRMKALTVPITVVNLRGGEGTFDVIDRPTARQARGLAPITATEPAPFRVEGAGAPVLSIQCFSEYNFTDAMVADLIRSDGGSFVGAFRIAREGFHLRDPLGPVELDALIWSVDEALSWLARNGAPSDGLTVVIGGPAWVAFWVGNRLNPNNFGQRLSFPNFSGGRYVSALSIPMRALPAAAARGQSTHLPNGAARVPVPEVAEVRSPKPPPASGRKKRSARSAAGVSTVPPDELRFAVALSFRGRKYRNFVKKVADELARHMGEERVLYDYFHKAEFARSDLGTHLPKLYVDKSDLVVVFVSRAYARSQWCGLEWGRIHDLIFRGQHERVMLVRLDSKTATLAGLPESAGYLDVSTSAERPEDVATEILKRHGQLRAKARGRAKPPGKASRVKRKKTAPGSAKSATGGELSTEAGAGPTFVALPISSDPEFWGSAKVEERLKDILASSARLSRSLDRRLMGELSKRDADLELPLRVARRITALGKGLGPAHMLTEACFEAVLAKNADAKGERAIARRLLCEWLPYGFPEVARVAVLRLDDGPSNSRNLEAGSHREHFVEVYMASLDGRACKFTKTRVDLFGGQSVAENMYAAPPGSVQRQSPQALADALVEVVGERFDVRSQDDVRSRFDMEARKGNTPYLVVPARMRPDGFPDGTIKRLNETFEKLHIVVLPESSDTSTTQETDLWTWMLDFLKDDL